MKFEIVNNDSNNVLKNIVSSVAKPIIVTDPPFNIGYKYNSYKDNMPEESYFNMLKEMFADCPFVIVHYPEYLHKLSLVMNECPTKIVSWVYNSNTAKQHRDIAFYGVKPDMSKVRQPYKNPNDKRIIERIKNGSGGGRNFMIGGILTKLKMFLSKRRVTLVKCRWK